MVQSSLETLKGALKAAEAKLADYEKVRSEVEGLRIAIAVMQGEPVPQLATKSSSEYEDLGVTAAARKFLRESTEPQDTRTIADALIARGLKTGSKNWIATVYATLRNGKMFRRTKDGRWALEDGTAGR
jgi:hypothetical protein